MNRGVPFRQGLRHVVVFFTLIAGCRAQFQRIRFDPIPVASPEQANDIVSTPRVSFGSYVQNISYKVLARSGMTFGGTVFGQLLDARGQPIYEMAANGSRTSRIQLSDDGDFLSLLSRPHGLYGFHHLEAPTPASTEFIEFRQNNETGELSIAKVTHMDWSEFGGLWIPCAGSASPWGTHLGSEEYPPDARLLETATTLIGLGISPSRSRAVTRFMRYYGLYGDIAPGAAGDLTPDSVRALFRPYRYGFVTELDPAGPGRYAAAKRYAMGRVSHELAFCLPDNRTCFTTDDGANTGFYMFVADAAGDLSRGRLYAARMSHNLAAGPLAFDVAWVPLLNRSISEAEVRAGLELKFSDIMDYVPFDPAAAAAGGSAAAGCPAGFGPFNNEGAAAECLRVRPGREALAAALETRRAAALLGATTEFTKWEGLTYSPERGALYTSLTAIQWGMEDRRRYGVPSEMYDQAGPNHIRAPYNPCGCVFELPVSLGAADTAGQPIPSASVPATMRDLICGAPAASSSSASTVGPLPGGVDSCAVGLPANPDNVAWIGGQDTLLIAEDTDYHVNAALWAYSLPRRGGGGGGSAGGGGSNATGGGGGGGGLNGTLTRILSAPLDAEVTAAYWVPSLGGTGWAYLVTSIQHPGPGSGSRGFAGYLGPIRMPAGGGGAGGGGGGAPAVPMLRNFVIAAMVVQFDAGAPADPAAFAAAFAAAAAAAVGQRIRTACAVTVLGWCTPSAVLCETPPAAPAPAVSISGRRSHPPSDHRSAPVPQLGRHHPAGPLDGVDVGGVAGGVGVAGGGGVRTLLDQDGVVVHFVLQRQDGGQMTAAVAAYMNGTSSAAAAGGGGSSAFFASFQTSMGVRGFQVSSAYWRRYPQYCPREWGDPACNVTDVRARITGSTFEIEFALGELPDFNMDRDGFGVWSAFGGLGLASLVLASAVGCQQWRMRRRRGKAGGAGGGASPGPSDEI